MGWKAVKEAYNIGHTVQVVPDKGICIGSSYIHDLIVIGFDGVLKKRYDGRGNDDLARYMREFDADPDKLKRLVLATDQFDSSITVFTDADGKILEKQCEKPGWPNVTHDGLMMYENTFSTDRAEVLEWAIRNSAAGVILATERIEQKKQELREAKAWLAESKAELKNLQDNNGE